MTLPDSERAEIARLAGIVHDLRNRVQGLGMMNVFAEPDLARQQSMDFAVARAELFKAQADLDKVVHALYAGVSCHHHHKRKA